MTPTLDPQNQEKHLRNMKYDYMMNHGFRKTGVIIALLLFVGTLHAGETQQRLENFLNDMQTMEATIIQTVMDAKKEIIDESEGQIWILRPDRFRLVYHRPGEQIYVADGKNLWFYDKDLEQVTVKEQGDALGSTPALLLSGTEPVSKNFRIEELGKHEGFYWLNLYPKSADANFDYIRIAMEGETLRAMEMVDNFGQTSRLYFDEVKRNPKLDQSKFYFTPPKGVDVIGNKQ